MEICVTRVELFQQLCFEFLSAESERSVNDVIRVWKSYVNASLQDHHARVSAVRRRQYTVVPGIVLAPIRENNVIRNSESLSRPGFERKIKFRIIRERLSSA